MIRQIKGVGRVRFPDTMTEDQVADAIEHEILKKPRPEKPAPDNSKEMLAALEKMASAIAALFSQLVDAVKSIKLSPVVNVSAPAQAAPVVTVSPAVVNVPQPKVVVQPAPPMEHRKLSIRFEIERDQYGSITSIIAKEI